MVPKTETIRNKWTRKRKEWTAMSDLLLLFLSRRTHGPTPNSGAGPAACDTELSGRSARRTRGQGHLAGELGDGAGWPPSCWSNRREHRRNTRRQQSQRSHVAQQATMMASAVLFVLRCQGRGLREDNDTEQEQNENAPPSETRLSYH